MAKGKKPFNICSASVYNAGYLTTTVLWVLIVDNTEKSMETGTATAVQFCISSFVSQFVPIGCSTGGFLKRNSFVCWFYGQNLQ